MFFFVGSKIRVYLFMPRKLIIIVYFYQWMCVEVFFLCGQCVFSFFLSDLSINNNCRLLCLIRKLPFSMGPSFDDDIWTTAMQWKAERIFVSTVEKKNQFTFFLLIFFFIRFLFWKSFWWTEGFFFACGVCVCVYVYRLANIVDFVIDQKKKQTYFFFFSFIWFLLVVQFPQ